jgi:6-pyruvoyltetrahydropterin/6-carboxytetrahydropterin synthase
MTSFAAAGGLQTASMRTRLERSYRFEAAHFLPKVPPGHKCARMHGHSYNVDVVIEGDIDPERGWVMDFAEIDEHVTPLVRMLDHHVLNEIDGLANPTSELLAGWLWQHLAPGLPALVEVVVSETPTSRCIYRGA